MSKTGRLHLVSPKLHSVREFKGNFQHDSQCFAIALHHRYNNNNNIRNSHPSQDEAPSLGEKFILLFYPKLWLMTKNTCAYVQPQLQLSTLQIKYNND